jgi:hypothetical protein
VQIRINASVSLEGDTMRNGLEIIIIEVVKHSYFEPHSHWDDGGANVSRVNHHEYVFYLDHRIHSFVVT